MEFIENVKVLITYWWAYLPILIFWLLVEIWGDYNRTKYLSGLDWIILRIKFPQEVAASFKAMEQVFANIHGVYKKDLDWDEKFFEGKVIDQFSFEVVGSNGEVGFYIRTLESHRNLIESSIYAQYPEAEISEATDYTQFLEGEAPSDEYDIFGMEMTFIEKNYFPIRTYEYFEDVPGGPRVPRVDPLASLSELLGSLKIGEHIWIQYNLEPMGRGWTKEADEKIEELTKSGTPTEEGGVVFRTVPPQNTAIAKGITSKISKIGFNTTVRWLYIAKKDIFSKSMGAAVSGMFKQFTAQNLNGFKPVKATLPEAKWPIGFMKKWPFKLIPYPWKVSGTHFNKKRLFESYLKRANGSKRIVLNTEEIATMYHLPSIEVKAPLLERIEARKGTPPSSLPIKENE